MTSVNLTLRLLRAGGARGLLGAGLMVIAEGSDLFALAKSGTEFYAAESCGKCVPCRLGTQQLVEIVAQMESGTGSLADHQAQVHMLDEAMEAASICGLGQVAANPLDTFLKNFPHFAPVPTAKPTGSPQATASAGRSCATTRA